mmetsp:Transcript_12330/g.18970  ORF Transcript_12330/g.18970 Transcript_12330/m.18970 type:complete len:241 (+) Transcript_12330:87-809(+)
MGRGSRRKSVLDDVEKTQADIDNQPHRLAANGILDLLKKYFEAHEDEVNAVDDRGCTPLIWAARNGHIEVVKYLVEVGGDVEMGGYGGMKSIHHAANNFQEAVVGVLLERGANPNGTDEMGNCSLHYACARGILNLVVTLIEKGADVNLGNDQGTTPLHKACIYGHLAIVKKLLQFGADADAADKDGNTPLHCAARVGFANICKHLAGEGKANLRKANNAGKSPAEMALDTEIQELLVAV